MTAATKKKPVERVTKKKLTLAEAAKQWEDAKRAIEEAKPLLDEAAPIVIAHLEKTGRSKYKDRIGLTFPPARQILDQTAVREFLGPKVKDFLKRTTPKPSLTLLEKPEKT